MSTPDHELIGFDIGHQRNAEAGERVAPQQGSETSDDPIDTTADHLLDLIKNPPRVESPDSLPAPTGSVDSTTSLLPLPSGAIGTQDGKPFSDWEAANYKADAMTSQVGDRFIVQAIAKDAFVVVPELASATGSAQTRRALQDDESDDRAYLQIPIDQLTLADFPPDHPVHRCGLARYRRYLKKNFKFKPAYRSMLPLLIIIPLGVLTYFYPVSTLNFLPPDVLSNIISSVPPEKLAAGTSIFGGLLAAFAFGRVVWQRNFRRYMLMPGFAKYEEGILKRKSTKIAYLNIVNYDVKQSVIGRLMNFGTIELSSAGSDGSEIEMHNVLAPRLIEVVLEGKMNEAKKARL